MFAVELAAAGLALYFETVFQLLANSLACYFHLRCRVPLHDRRMNDIHLQMTVTFDCAIPVKTESQQH